MMKIRLKYEKENIYWIIAVLVLAAVLFWKVRFSVWAIGHFQKDVLPWILWGNSPDDTTTREERLNAFIVDGGMETIDKALASAHINFSLRETVDNVADWITDTYDAVTDWVTDTYNTVTEGINDIWEGITNWFK